MKIYISIPISGKNEKEQRRLAQLKAMTLKSLKHEVVNPFIVADETEKRLGRKPTYYEYIEDDLKALSTCDAIFMMNGWTDSKGCKIELAKALELNLIILNKDTKLR